MQQRGGYKPGWHEDPPKIANQYERLGFLSSELGPICFISGALRGRLTRGGGSPFKGRGVKKRSAGRAMKREKMALRVVRKKADPSIFEKF